MNEAWRSLRVGDEIKIVRLPSYADTPGISFPRETRLLYQKLIARRRSSRIWEVDAWGAPWIRCRFRRKNGDWEHHYLAVCDDSWVRVKKRRRRALK